MSLITSSVPPITTPMKVVAIGGGTGLSTLLRGLKLHVTGPLDPTALAPNISRLTALVTVTDEGGSSGRLRREFGVPPPGDIRNCLVALAEDEKLFTQLFNFRFANGRGLRGHSFGNLFLTALTHLTHDFAAAVRVSSEILAIRGEIFPSTLADVRLQGELRDGRVVNGESRITKTRTPIHRLRLVPAGARALPEALKALREADLITLGPGSLYTSLIPNLLVRGIREEIARTKARRILICNLMTQPGETRRYSAADHLQAICDHAGRKLFDDVILNSQPLSPSLQRRYAAQHAEPVQNDITRVSGLGVKPFIADLLMEEGHAARHNFRRLARLLLEIASQPLRQPA